MTKDAFRGWTSKKESSIAKDERSKKIWKKKSEGKNGEACGLILYANDEGSKFKTRKQGKPLILKSGSMLNEGRDRLKTKDESNLLLHVEDVRDISSNP